jgi:hypothetical protein
MYWKTIENTLQREKTRTQKSRSKANSIEKFQFHLIGIPGEDSRSMVEKNISMCEKISAAYVC